MVDPWCIGRLLVANHLWLLLVHHLTIAIDGSSWNCWFLKLLLMVLVCAGSSSWKCYGRWFLNHCWWIVIDYWIVAGWLLLIDHLWLLVVIYWYWLFSMVAGCCHPIIADELSAPGSTAHVSLWCGGHGHFATCGRQAERCETGQLFVRNWGPKKLKTCFLPRNPFGFGVWAHLILVLGLGQSQRVELLSLQDPQKSMLQSTGSRHPQSLWETNLPLLRVSTKASSSKCCFPTLPFPTARHPWSWNWLRRFAIQFLRRDAAKWVASFRNRSPGEAKPMETRFCGQPQIVHTGSTCHATPELKSSLAPWLQSWTTSGRPENCHWQISSYFPWESCTGSALVAFPMQAVPGPPQQRGGGARTLAGRASQLRNARENNWIQ